MFKFIGAITLLLTGISSANAWNCTQKCPSSVFSGSIECRFYQNRNCSYSSDSSLSVMTEKYFNFKIINESGSNIQYSVYGATPTYKTKVYHLNNKETKKLKYYKAYGTNGSNIQSYKSPKIKWNIGNGELGILNVQDHKEYYFIKKYNLIRLVNLQTYREWKVREKERARPKKTYQKMRKP